MHRKQQLKNIESTSSWDLIVIGGGASGLGAALDAASRGFKVLLLERGDFACETSSKSTKLIHGGVRYLRQGRVGLVHESLKERYRLFKNAPHLVHPIQFFLPAKNFVAKIYYYIGIKLYDLLAFNLQLGPSHMISKKELEEALPTLKKENNGGAISFFDGQFDDARLALNLAQTIVEQKGTVVNYMEAVGFIKDNCLITGVIAKDLLSGKEYQLKAKGVINATGAFTDTLRCVDNTQSATSIVPSQGAHIVLDRSFFPGNNALIIPETPDGRVLFAIPWKNHVLIGTTDVQLDSPLRDPKPQEEEIDYLLKMIGSYLIKQPQKTDILSSFAGLRPLAKPDNDYQNTAKLSRESVVSVSPSKLISIAGGKWTTYRQMGEESIELAIKTFSLPEKESQTANLKIHGWLPAVSQESEWSYYGADEELVKALAENNPALLEKLHPDIPCRPVDVIWAIRNEMAVHADDILARRSRCLLLNAKATQSITDKVVSIMRQEGLS